MKRTKENAFTLIELLAVIVILAIIALIAVPVVMNIINKANKSAFKDSAYGIIKAGELYYTDHLMEGTGMTEDKVFTFPNDTLGLEINGSKPTGGTMTVNKEGKISLAITNGKYCVTKGFEEDDVTISDDVTNCGVSSGNNPHSLTALAKTHNFSGTSTATEDIISVPACITNKTKCDAGTAVAIEVAPEVVYKFYVLNDDTTKNEVILIMDRNLGDTVSLGTTHGLMPALTALKERTSGWTNIPAYIYTLEDDSDGTATSTSTSTATSTSTSTATNEESLVENVRARLPKYSDIVVHASGTSVPDWLKSDIVLGGVVQGYWLSTSSSTGDPYSVSNGLPYGAIGLASHNTYVISNLGIRPVITLSK